MDRCRKSNSRKYIKNGELIIRLHKSENQNQNIVNASVAFISFAFLKKAKSYIAKYQRESLDLYVCYDLLKQEKSENFRPVCSRFYEGKNGQQKKLRTFLKFT